jgi:hypothetical protein
MMNGIQFFIRMNLWLVFIVLFIGHGILYYAANNPDWFLLTSSASLVDTGILGMVQFWIKTKIKQTEKN